MIDEEFINETCCLAQGKYTKKRIALNLTIIGKLDGSQSIVKIVSGSDDINMLPAALIVRSDFSGNRIHKLWAYAVGDVSSNCIASFTIFYHGLMFFIIILISTLNYFDSFLRKYPKRFLYSLFA